MLFFSIYLKHSFFAQMVSFPICGDDDQDLGSLKKGTAIIGNDAVAHMHTIKEAECSSCRCSHPLVIDTSCRILYAG